MARQQRRTSLPTKRPPYGPWIAAGLVAAAFIVLVAMMAGRPRMLLPKVGDHWHAPYTVEICGRRLPPVPASPGDVHTHGDGILHIHPQNASSSGRRATLSLAFRGSTLHLEASAISVGGVRHANGERCPDGRAARLQVLVRGTGRGTARPVRDFLAYVPQNGDEIRIVFGP